MIISAILYTPNALSTVGLAFNFNIKCCSEKRWGPIYDQIPVIKKAAATGIGGAITVQITCIWNANQKTRTYTALQKRRLGTNTVLHGGNTKLLTCGYRPRIW